MKQTHRHLKGSLALALCVGIAGGLTSAGRAQEQLPAKLKIVRVEAYPQAIALRNPYEYRQVLLTGQLETGERIDVTRMAQVEADARLVKISPTGLVRPVADGKGQVSFTVAGFKAAIPVQVTGQRQRYEVSFVRDVMPTLSKIGCNAGTCHGAQQGKNGFKLSLRGYDPLFDHIALTDDLEGRRFNRADPERSRMLLKPSGSVPHVGGMLIQPGDPYYELIKAWIASGVKLDLNGSRIRSIEATPKSAVLPLPGMKQQMAVMAKYSDGSMRDVTAE